MISVVIIAYNAERTFEACLDSVKWADEIVVVDSGSSDRTVEIAEKYNARIYEREFDDFSSQKNYAISNADCEWILSLDADEVATDELSEELLKISGSNDFDGYSIERLNNIYGRFVEYDRPDLQLRFFKKGEGEFKQPVHERIDIKSGRVSVLQGKILHYTMKNIYHHVEKIDEFTGYDVDFYPAGTMNMLWKIKNLFVRPILKFVQHYFVKGAFKDGMAGYIYSVNTILGEFITFSKRWEKR